MEGLALVNIIVNSIARVFGKSKVEYERGSRVEYYQELGESEDTKSRILGVRHEE